MSRFSGRMGFLYRDFFTNTTKFPNISGVGLMAGALACAGLLSAGAAVGGTVTSSGSQWNDAAPATNGPSSGSGTTVVTTGNISSTLALSYGADARLAGSDSASAGYSSSYGGSAELT